MISQVVSTEPQFVLLTTKLAPPRVPATFVPRERLLRNLDAIFSHRLTLISASAGWGKTTLLTTWLASRRATLPQESGVRNQGSGMLERHNAVRARQTGVTVLPTTISAMPDALPHAEQTLNSQLLTHPCHVA
jgi:hypothetical protein